MMDQQTPEEAELLPGGDYIAPDVSPEVRDFIQKCRTLIYSEEFTPIIQQALTGANSLAEGVAPILLQIITRAEDKLGPLSEEDFATVALHLAGTLVGTARILGDPEAENPEEAAQEIVATMMEMVSGGDSAEGEETEEVEEEEPGEEEEAPQGALGQFA